MRSLLLLLVFALMACEGTPEHRVGFPGADGTGLQELGSVRITERATTRVEVANTGRQPLTLAQLALEDGWRGVLRIDEEATDCSPGLTLSVEERCFVGIAFEPGNDVDYRDSLHVDYRAIGGDAVLRSTLRVRGAAILDCSVSDEYLASFESGASNAEAQMALDVVEGRAAGEALSADDGYARGYDSAYDDAYREAYDASYDLGVREGYDDGYAEGASIAACREGEVDGYADGADAGLIDGENDGFVDGDAAGYDDGYINGEADGEADTCFVEKVDLDPSLPAKCVTQGYEATYSRGPYNAAYEAALAANVAYLEGVSLGEREGVAMGQAEGSADGYRDGYQRGDDLGFADGDVDQYEACYADAVDEGYEDGYFDAYDAFFRVAYEDAYGLGYQDGYAVGTLYCL